MAAGERNARRDARTLGAERLLGHLHDDLAALLQHVLDLRRGAPAAAAAASLAVAVVVELGFVELGAIVADVQEAGALQADVHERGLHPGQDPGDPTLVDAPDYVAFARPLDVELDDLVGLAHGNPRLPRADVHEDLVSHAKFLLAARAQLRSCGPRGQRRKRGAA